MNLAMVLQHKLLLGIQRFMYFGRAIGHRRPLDGAGCTALSQSRPIAAQSHCPAAARTPNGNALNTRLRTQSVMPLRVLRVVESDLPRSSTGRLVISGRMDDVCAELDRLVAREAALS